MFSHFSDYFACALLLPILLACLLFTIVIPRRVIWSLRHGVVGLNAFVIRRSQSPILFWLVLSAAPFFWWLCFRVLLHLVVGLME